jgi:hypothetical protein
MVKQQYVDIEYMRNKNDMHFHRILEACDLHGITDLLQFRHNWNQGIISVGTLKTGYPHIQALSQDNEQGVHPHAAT